MYVSHVELSNFRNYLMLAIDVAPGLVVLRGPNAQGKTNFLEALFVLATSRSPRTTRDRELVAWDVPIGEPPVSRFSASVQRSEGAAAIEVLVMAQPDRPRGRDTAGVDRNDQTFLQGSGVQKRIRVNGVPRRAIDLLGTLRVVLFRPEDIELVGGSPSVRRRALDILLSQGDRQYIRSLLRYGRVLQQRNHLLRRVGEGAAAVDELAPWDQTLSVEGAYLLERRRQAVERLALLAAASHGPLSGESERLEVSYQCSLDLPLNEDGDEAAIAAAFREQLRSAWRREVSLGQTTIGPHRDDLEFLVDGAPAAVYGSRGQQRTAALSWKLAEASYLRETTGDDPVVLLDDVLSELDATRRRSVLDTVLSYQQVFLTTTGAELGGGMQLAPAAMFDVMNGTLTRTP